MPSFSLLQRSRDIRARLLRRTRVATAFRNNKAMTYTSERQGVLIFRFPQRDGSCRIPWQYRNGSGRRSPSSSLRSKRDLRTGPVSPVPHVTITTTNPALSPEKKRTIFSTEAKHCRSLRSRYRSLKKPPQNLRAPPDC